MDFDPWANLPDTQDLNRCPSCGERTYYEKVLNGLMRLHLDGDFLCPEWSNK